MPCRPAISSMSLGRAWHHALEPKLTAASKAGYAGIEVFEEDLIAYAEAKFGSKSEPARLAAANAIYTLCSERNLQVVCLQPFRFYEGLLDRDAHAACIAEFRTWFKLARALHTDLIAIASTFLPADQCSGDLNLIVQDMREVADLGAKQTPPLRFTYEALAWGTHVDTWEKSWDVVSAVSRPNFGICLDTFNIAGRVYADPTQPGGVRPTGEEDTNASIARLLERVDVSKVFYIQVVDAERLAAPLVPGHAFYNAEQPARMSWSRNCRLFYGEGYLPITAVAKAIFEGLGYDGFVSMELFSRSCAQPAVSVPDEHAQRGMAGWRKLRCDVDVDAARVAVDGLDEVRAAAREVASDAALHGDVKAGAVKIGVDECLTPSL